MHGKRIIQEFNIVDSSEDQLIIVHNVDNPMQPTIQGSYSINKYNPKGPAKFHSLKYVASLFEIGALKLQKQYEAWDLCYN